MNVDGDTFIDEPDNEIGSSQRSQVSNTVFNTIVDKDEHDEPDNEIGSSQQRQVSNTVFDTVVDEDEQTQNSTINKSSKSKFKILHFYIFRLSCEAD